MASRGDKILLAHGSGGLRSRDIVRDVFVRYFSNSALNSLGDAAYIELSHSRLAYTTDSFVVRPLIFPGGDIGKLAVCGTINDLSVSGARPLYLTAGFIIEEGLEIELLEKIVRSMAKTANEAGVRIVAGDTKVVEKGGCDKIFINTSGIGEVFTKNPMGTANIRTGDAILINGFIADHGMAIMAAREGLSIDTKIESDCAPLHSLVETLVAAVPDVRFMRDATRGGLATVLCEAVDGENYGIEISEEKIPVREGTAAVAEILGIDPLYAANEGKLVAIVPKECENTALAALKSHPLGKDASTIGHVTGENFGKVTLVTSIGTKRLITMLTGDLLPRIC